MASKVMWPPMVQARRQMVNLAAKKAEAAKTLQIETSMLPSGLKVASVDSDATAISTVGLLVKSGPSYESYDILGASHAIRLNVGMATRNATAFGIVRSVQQAGGSIDVLGSREYTLYSMSLPRHLMVDNFDFLHEAVTAPAFKPWEQRDNVHKRMALEVASVDGPTKAVELLHKAAYRQGLGNSIFSPDFMVGKHTPSVLKDFHAKTHTMTRSILVGHGIDHMTMSRLGQQFDLEKGHGPTVPGKYFGADLREDRAGSQAYVALAAESAPSSDVKAGLAFMLLKNVLGNGPRILRGDGAGKLDKAVSKVGGNKAVAGVNYSYSDSSLTGAFIVAESSNVGQVVTEVMACLRNLSVTEEELKAAKKTLQIDLSEQMLNPQANIEALGAHTLFAGNSIPSQAGSMSEMIAMVSLADVQAAAQKLSKAKFSMGAAGNLGKLPYIDTL